MSGRATLTQKGNEQVHAEGLERPHARSDFTSSFDGAPEWVLFIVGRRAGGSEQPLRRQGPFGEELGGRTLPRRNSRKQVRARDALLATGRELLGEPSQQD